MREAITQAKLRTEVHDELMWMLERLDKLTDLRNGFVHQVAMIGTELGSTKLHLDPLGLLDRYREVKRDPEGAYKVLRTDLIKLTDYAPWFFDHARMTLDRPTLQSFTLFPDLGKRLSVIA